MIQGREMMVKEPPDEAEKEQTPFKSFKSLEKLIRDVEGKSGFTLQGPLKEGGLWLGSIEDENLATGSIWFGQIGGLDEENEEGKKPFSSPFNNEGWVAGVARNGLYRASTTAMTTKHRLVLCEEAQCAWRVCRRFHWAGLSALT
jgi:hypothetical protein